MPVRERTDGWLEPDAPQRSRESVEREVEVARAVDGAVEGTVADGPGVMRVTPIEAAKQRAGMGHHDRGRRRRKLRIALVVGAMLLAMLPWLLRMTDVLRTAAIDRSIGEDLLLTTMTVLKAVMTVIALA